MGLTIFFLHICNLILFLPQFDTVLTKYSFKHGGETEFPFLSTIIIRFFHLELRHLKLILLNKSSTGNLFIISFESRLITPGMIN